ncbi:hypothetical protein AX17_007521 [Amanita inopinata Kibby_2008]|nr:hypothetical protein AX17_007521 [Amanita inopinata Kibby_2008]
MAQPPLTTMEDVDEFYSIHGWREIRDYSDDLLHFYSHPEFHNRWQDGWKVTKIEILMSPAPYTFKYLNATLTDPVGGLRLMQISREVQRWIKSKWFGKRLGTVGYVGIISERTPGDRLLCRITFPEKHRISLPQLMVLVRSVHAIAPEYRFYENSYWFPFIIEKTLKRLVPYKEEYFNGAEYSVQSLWMKLLTEHFVGDFNVDGVLREYEKRLAESNRQIANAMNNPGNQVNNGSGEQPTVDTDTT